MLHRLGINTNDVPADVLDTLTQAHMNELQQSLEVRPETIEVLEWASGRFRRAMISNFDYAPALYEALNRFRSAFETVVVSVEVGWRKPHGIIFERTFQTMGIEARDALFIGDQLFLDVLGSWQCGMDVVWLDSGREVWTAEFPRPTYTVQSIREIIDILGEQQ
jgi:putative hydrolase of the HAD superfamily